MKRFDPAARDVDQTLAVCKERAQRLLISNIVIFDDFPQKGHRYIDFYLTFDVNPDVRNSVIEYFYTRYAGFNIDAVVAIGSGGFTLGACIAYKLNIPLFPIRKLSETVFDSYVAEVGMVYAKRELSLSRHIDANNKNVVLIDDTIASGGSFSGAISLLKSAGANIIEIGTVFETTSKNGRKLVSPVNVAALMSRESF